MINSVNWENVWLSVTDTWIPTIIGVAVIVVVIIAIRIIKNKNKSK